MRHDRLTRHEFQGRHNALRSWPRLQHPFRVTLHVILLSTAKILPLRLKNQVLRLLGMDIGRGVSVGLGCMFDVFFPERISIGDHSTIGYGTVILTHETTQNAFRVGDVSIGANVLIGANCTILPGVEIGDNAVVSAHSLVNRDVPAGAFVGGVPAQQLDGRPE